jgi:hypothetical protein
VRIVAFVPLFVLLIGAAPATRSTTTRAARLPPIHTVTMHALAMAAGDPDGVRRAYVAKTEEELAVVNAYCGMASAISRLLVVAKDKYGEHGFELIGFGKIFEEEVDRLKKAESVVHGDEALVYTIGKDKPPLVLVFVNGEWKIAVARSFPGKMQRRAARIRAQASAYNELAAEIKAGRYKEAGDARAAGTEKVKNAMAQAEMELARRATTQQSASPEK